MPRKFRFADLSELLGHRCGDLVASRGELCDAIEAATDLYASRFEAFRRITLRLSVPGLFACSLLTFIPAVGDFVNSEFLGSRDTTMVGNVIQRLYLTNNDYPQASALSFILMAAISVAVIVYARLLGGRELTA